MSQARGIMRSSLPACHSHAARAGGAAHPPARALASVSSAAEDLRPQFRLRPGQDDRLIAWLASFAPRARSEAIREALRAYLAAPESTEQSLGEENVELAAALDALF